MIVYYRKDDMRYGEFYTWNAGDDVYHLEYSDDDE